MGVCRHNLTTFYRRGEVAKILAMLYTASNLANASSGLFRIR
jgi:hypothetical protein